MYYHIVTDLERRFATAEEALNAYKNKKVMPRIPEHKMSDENDITPRICVCKWLPDCLTAIGLQNRLTRCLGANDCMDSLDPLNQEVYPVIILEFPDHTDTYRPPEDDVPDSKITHEEWILRPTEPSRVTLRWLHSNSILFQTHRNGPIEFQAISCNFATELQGKNHPWLNGQGHILFSDAHASEFEDYSNIPAGKHLGTIQTLQSTLTQINDIMSWKILSGKHEIKIRSKKLEIKPHDTDAYLEIVCVADTLKAPELYLQLVTDPEFCEEPLMKSQRFNSLEELRRIGVTYNNTIYRLRIQVIKADSKTGYIPADPCDMSNLTPEQLSQIIITQPKERSE